MTRKRAPGAGRPALEQEPSHKVTFRLTRSGEADVRAFIALRRSVIKAGRTFDASPILSLITEQLPDD